MTKKRGVIFSDEEVRATLAGRRCQFRRVIREQPLGRVTNLSYWSDGLWRIDHRGVPNLDRNGEISGMIVGLRLRCPFGTVGDRLWVREAWAELRPEHYQDVSESRDLISTRYGTPRVNGVAYRSECGPDSSQLGHELGYRWSPSIHMPRWASRITLEITGVRVERVQDISEEDARAEGLVGNRNSEALRAVAGVSLQECFGTLWDRIHAKKPGQSWKDSPWVWVVSFRRVTP